jgi:hypothetical protein
VPLDVEVVGRKIRRSGQRFTLEKREDYGVMYGGFFFLLYGVVVLAFEVDENKHGGLCFLCYRLMIDQEFMLSVD